MGLSRYGNGKYRRTLSVGWKAGTLSATAISFDLASKFSRSQHRSRDPGLHRRTLPLRIKPGPQQHYRIGNQST